MMRQSMWRWVALGIACCAAGACLEKKPQEVPPRVWEAAIASCENYQRCYPGEFADRYTSFEQCADVRTKHFPWEDYTQECVEAWIAVLNCNAEGQCYGTPSDECELAVHLRSYHCWRYNTSYYGVMCGDPSSEQWREECQMLCGPWGHEFESVLCSEHTPDYCVCGGERCAEGEYCCSCLNVL